MSLVHNEQTKLTASWLSALATAVIAAGAVAPLAALIYGVSGAPASGVPLLLVAASCFAFGTFLHALGRLSLRRLR